jgi:hypothetical protein
MADLSLAEVALHAVFRSRLGKAEMIQVFVYCGASKPRMESTTSHINLQGKVGLLKRAKPFSRGLGG